MSDYPIGQPALPCANMIVARFIRDGGGPTGDPVDTLMNVASGVYAVLDAVAVTFIDLDTMRAVRTPRVFGGVEPNVLRRDGDWLKVEILTCTAGRGLHLAVELDAETKLLTHRGPSKDPVLTIVPMLA